jgi:putative transposase
VALFPLLAQRGIVVTYETVRQWCLKFGQTYANALRRRRPRCGDKWHLDEMYLKIVRRINGRNEAQPKL